MRERESDIGVTLDIKWFVSSLQNVHFLPFSSLGVKTKGVSGPGVKKGKRGKMSTIGN